jgi:hypothetical protein
MIYHLQECSTLTDYYVDSAISLSTGSTYNVTSDQFNGFATIVDTIQTGTELTNAVFTLAVTCPTPTMTPTPTITPGVCSESTQYCLYTNFSATSQYDGTYSIGGVYNGNAYYVNGSNYIFYNNTKWCLSSSLGGDCVLFGKEPCYTACPDLVTTYFTAGACNIPTPTPNPCDTFDFSVIFDCDLSTSSTPLPTPSNTPSLTLSPTPSPSNVCGGKSLTLSVNCYNRPSPTPTNTPTQTNIARNVEVVSEVSFRVLDEVFVCQSTKQLYDCSNGVTYYVNSPLNLSGTQIVVGDVFTASINGLTRCLQYVGSATTSTNSTIDTIISIEGTSCNDCGVSATPTPTFTVTPTITPEPQPSQTRTPQPTPTPTRTPTSSVGITPTQTRTQTPTNTITSTPTQSQTQTPTPSRSAQFSSWEAATGSTGCVLGVCTLGGTLGFTNFYTSVGVTPGNGVNIYSNTALTTKIPTIYLKYGTTIFRVINGVMTTQCGYQNEC